MGWCACVHVWATAGEGEGVTSPQTLLPLKSGRAMNSGLRGTVDVPLSTSTSCLADGRLRKSRDSSASMIEISWFEYLRYPHPVLRATPPQYALPTCGPRIVPWGAGVRVREQ